MKNHSLSNFGARMTFLAGLAVLPALALAGKTIIVIDDDETVSECVKWLKESPQVTSGVEALKVCRRGATVECMKMIYQEPRVYSRIRAAELCTED